MMKRIPRRDRATLAALFAVLLAWAAIMAFPMAALAQTAPPITPPATGAEKITCLQNNVPKTCTSLQVGQTLLPTANTWTGTNAFTGDVTTRTADRTLNLTQYPGINTTCSSDNTAIVNAITWTGISRVIVPGAACLLFNGTVTIPTGIQYDGFGTAELRFSGIGALATGLQILGSETASVPLATSGSTCPTVTAPNIAGADTAVYSCALPSGLNAGNAAGARIFISSSDVWTNDGNAYTKGWQVKVSSITGGGGSTPYTINLAEPVPSSLSMTSGGAPVFSYSYDNGPTVFQGFKVTGPFTGGVNSQRCVLIYRASRVTWRNNVVEGCDGTNIEVNRSYDVELSGGSTNSVYATGLGYGIVISYGTVNAYVHDMTADNVNDFLATGGYTLVNRRTIIHNVTATCRWYCFNAHPSQLDYSVTGSIAQAHALANTANQGVVYNGAGNLVVSGNQFVGMRITGIMVQPLVYSGADTYATITGNSVTMGANASTRTGIMLYPYTTTGTPGQLHASIANNVINGGDYSIAAFSLVNGAAYGRVSITGNTVGVPPAVRNLFVNLQANTSSPVLNGLTITGNTFALSAADSMTYLFANANGLLTNATLANNTYNAQSASTIPIRLVNVDQATVSCGNIIGSPTSPWLVSGSTNLKWSCNYGLPTISSGFGTSPTAPSGNGVDQFQLTVGSAPGTSGVLALKASPLGNGWACTFNDITTNATHNIVQTATTTTTVTVADYSRTAGTAQNFNAGDVITGSCKPY